jgi:hypothetical protein
MLLHSVLVEVEDGVVSVLSEAWDLVPVETREKAERGPLYRAEVTRAVEAAERVLFANPWETVRERGRARTR